MDGGISFGQTFKKLREQAKIPSKTLSTKVGKAITYVSQLERGLIKNPDYITCYKLLELVGEKPHSIEEVLKNHGITNRINISTEEIDKITGSVEKPNYQQAGKRLRFYDEKKREAKYKNNTIHSTLDTLTDTDVTRASVVINNICNLTQDEYELDFLCDLFAFDYSLLSSEKRAEILGEIKRIVERSTSE